jgi:hypothetical protein
MAPVTGYKRVVLPDGSPGTEVQYADGVRQTVDANHQPVGGTAAPAMGVAPEARSSARQQVQMAPTGGGNFTSGFENMRGPSGPSGGGGGQGASPKQASYRPTLQGPSGWAGPRNVGVHGGASVTGDRLRTAANIYSGDRAFNEKGHPYSGGRGTSPLYDKFAAKGNAMEAKVRGMASGMGMGSSSSSSSSGWVPNKYGSSSSSSGAYGTYPEAEPYVDPLLAMMGRQPVGLDPRVMSARYALTQRAMGQYGEPGPNKKPLHRWVAKRLDF